MYFSLSEEALRKHSVPLPWLIFWKMQYIRLLILQNRGIDTVKEFNDIKTSLAMATGEEKSYINDLMESYNDLGQELGSITSDVAASADSWLRQGRTLNETNQLIRDSMVLSKDTNISSEQSAEILTATLNGFSACRRSGRTY